MTGLSSTMKNNDASLDTDEPEPSPMTQPPGRVTATFLGHVRRKKILLLGGIALAIGLAIVAITQGAYDITLDHLLQVLSGAAAGPADIVVWKIRLPRIVAALVAGWGLSLAGLTIQSLLKNPLGSPMTLGISHGAAFGASVAIVLLGSGLVWVTVCAFAGAMGSTMVIMLLACVRRLSADAIILAGVALTSLFMAGTVLVQYLSSDTQLAMVVFWTFGDVTRASWREIGVLSLVVVGVTLFLMLRRWDLNAMAAGEETASGLGVRVARLRLVGMLAAAMMAAVVTAFHGVIGFVGLIAPHIARRLVGADHGLVIPFSSVIGALLLLAADTLGRAMIGSGALPVGIITSFMGAPMFLYLLIRGRR
ncbi:iron ABC transporter permease [Desulfosarcina ovata subsp. sediminis]|uniref:Iron ABC transporter permease n=1 Tax=Desulfosarcina ovata subsp. sediminis TaxID=885957 RepID=A0A5K7ZMK4_9BACT|nr:iron ABC transporter permease [Desulfosarcina ovata]BBO82281.1 iron ABC transporter permease [Desulfosarcina ovata subsp. sediminis]